MPKSKFFRVATSGATTDGRTIKPQDLIDMASTYDPATYQARVNLEHIQSMYPGSTFRPYGDVLALETRPVTLNVGGKAEERTGLYAQVDAHDSLVELNRNSEKLFTSIQVRPNFAGSGKAYLDGLAFTDNPASLGTETMKFCAGLNAAGNGEASPLHFRKRHADAIFTAAEETTLEFVDDGAPLGEPDQKSFLAMLRRCFDGFAARPAEIIPPVVVEKPASPFADPAVVAAFASLRSVMEAGAEQAAAQATAAAAAQAETAAALAALQGEFAAAKAETATLKAALEAMPEARFTTRARQTGGDDVDRSLKADC